MKKLCSYYCTYLNLFWGHLSGSSLFAQSSDEIPKSVDLSLHLRPAYHAQFNGTPLEFENGGFKFDHIIVDVGGKLRQNSLTDTYSA